MTTLETLNRWLADAPENEHLEFKEAKQQYDTTKLLRYCVALANEGGGHLVLGVSDKRPRQVVGTQAFQNRGEITARILEALRMRVEVQELQHPNGRVLVFAVPPRPAGTPLHHEGAYLMRAGEELVPMSPNHLKRIFAEGGPDWFDRPAWAGASAEEVVALFDTQSFFDLMQLPYPTSRDGVLERLAQERLIERKTDGWSIANLAAILLAKRLDAFSPELARKAARVVIYEGTNKLATRYDEPQPQGYAVGFEKLVDFVHSSAPHAGVRRKRQRHRQGDPSGRGVPTACARFSYQRDTHDGGFVLAPRFCRHEQAGSYSGLLSALLPEVREQRTDV